MTIPSTTDDLIAELGRFAYNTEYSVDADMAMNAIETIRQLEKDAARYAKALTEITEIEFELFGADWEEIEAAQHIAETALQATQ